MIPNRTFIHFLFWILIGLSAAASLSASPMERMKERLPAIDALLLSGHLGENNQGYVEGRKSLSGEQDSLMKEENTDRREVYQLIASRTQSSAAEVGKQRALRIAQQARAGVWIQDARGHWSRKES